MSIETRTSRSVKKTGVEKSSWTVPLSVKKHNLLEAKATVKGLKLL
jgi:hypothetical protein